MSILLGCIADDFTGATDLANMLVRAGMRTIQLIGVPDGTVSARGCDAVVVALKSRTTPVDQAVSESLGAFAWLKDHGARQIYFKYCSTFDSTDQGNIGPVTDALLEALDSDFTVACPAFPENKRTIYKGYLFVGDVLLNESGMEHHPLTPMRDANLVRVLQRQTRGKVGLISHTHVGTGYAWIRHAMDELKREGVRVAIVDALRDEDLMAIGKASADLALVTGGSGLALGLPQNFIASGQLSPRADVSALPPVEGLRAIVAGSCSKATLGQIAAFAASHPARKVDPFEIAAGKPVVEETLAWASRELASGPILIYASAPPDEVKQAQTRLGVAEAGAMLERALAEITAGLVDRGVRQLIVAGGETSGAVVQRLGIKGLLIGPQIDPGIPWTVTLGEPQIALALKSGNFGAPDFFSRAWEMLPG
jgi:uncharacterized protein YgbK (DUF1537 family)